VDKTTTVLQTLDINKEALINFKSGANVYLMGTFSQDKNDIKNQLNWLNINTLSTFNDAVTHLIIGSKPKDIADFYTTENPPYLLEHQLYAALQEVGKEDKFLVQEAAVGESQMTEGVKQLLQSNDAISISLGLEMLKTGGVPADILDDLIVLNKTFNDAKIRTECKKILELNCTDEWVNIIKDKQLFVDIALAKNKDIRDKLEKMTKSVDKKHVHLLAMLFFNYFEKGINFSLANFGLHATERVAALNALTKGDFFDFFKGVGYHN
jgi:hypothetical protein